ncbi:MAG: head GIN domain-containing protein [bacterium]
MRRFFQAIACILSVTVFGVAPTTAAGNLFGLFDGVRGSGNMTEQERDLKPFDRIETNGSWDIVVTVGSSQQVILHFEDNIIDLIETEVRGKTLEIFAEESFSTRKSSWVEITLPNLAEVYSAGSGDIRVERLDSEVFELSLSGSGDFYLGGHADELGVKISGSGDGVLVGSAENLELRISGSGDIDSRDLIAKQVSVTISGSGDVQLYAEESFDGRISGSGDITYYGKPEDVRTRVSGSGDIRRR